jgi:hypothetical protein
MARNKTVTNEALTALRTRVEELNKQIREESQSLLNLEFTKVFEKYPKLLNFSWSQYTPYFNDGEECIFHVNTDSLIPDFTDESAEDHDYEYAKKDSEYVTINGKWQSRELEVSDEKKLNNEAFDNLYEIVSAIDDQTMKVIYGDHVRVTISKTEGGLLKVETKDYAHD